LRSLRVAAYQTAQMIVNIKAPSTRFDSFPLIFNRI